MNFDPLVLPTCIEPSADPILRARGAAYAESFRRRAKEVLLNN
jgi:catalase